MLPLNTIIRFKKCRMCLVKLGDNATSLYDDNNYLLLRFQKCFRVAKVHNFLFTKNLAALCPTCISRLADFVKFQSMGRKNMREYETDQLLFEMNCLICFKPEDKKQRFFPLMEGDGELAKKFGKCLQWNIDKLVESKSRSSICELCKIKLDEFDMIRSAVRKFDEEYFGNPHKKDNHH